MKKIYSAIGLLFLCAANFNNIFASNIQLKHDEKLIINSDLIVESASVASDGDLNIESAATLSVGNLSSPGNFELKNGGNVVVQEGSTIIIYGDLIIDNDGSLNINGKVAVYGNIYLKNSAKIIGDGVLEYKNSISINNDAKITVTKIYNPDLITSVNSAITTNEIISIYVYSLNGHFLKSWENVDHSYLNFGAQSEFNNEKFLLVKVSTASKIYTEKRFIQ